MGKEDKAIINYSRAIMFNPNDADNQIKRGINNNKYLLGLVLDS